MRAWNFEIFLWLFKQQMRFHQGESFKTYLHFIHKSFKCNYRKSVNKEELKILRNEWERFFERNPLKNVKCSICGRPVHVWDCKMERKMERTDKLLKKIKEIG